MPIDITAFAYAALVAGGGVLGYVKSSEFDSCRRRFSVSRCVRVTTFSYFPDSIPSLAAGLLFGSVLGYGAYQTSQDPTNVAVFLGTSTALGGMMGYRFYNSGKIMPAGVIALLRYLLMPLDAFCSVHNRENIRDRNMC